MEKVLFFKTELKPFFINGSLCNPISYLDGYILPLGWEEYLQEYEIIEHINNENIDL